MIAQYSPRYAYIDPSGRVVLDVSAFQAAQVFSDGMAAVLAANHRWGYVNRSGDLVIATQFEQAKPFSEELAAVQTGGKWGFIDKAGRVVIEPQYKDVNSFSEGLAVVVKEKSISQPTNTPMRDWSKMPGQVVSVMRMVDVSVPLNGDSANPPPAPEVEVIDKFGHTVLSMNEQQPNIYENARFSEGLLDVAHSATRKAGFVDRTGRFVIAPEFIEAAPFSEGLARVAIRENGEEKVGFIDREGNFVISAQFNTDADFRNSQDFSEGLAGLTEGLRPTVTEAERYVFID